MQMSENSYLKNYNVTDLLNYDITFSASTKAFKLILHNWFNTGRGKIAQVPCDVPSSFLTDVVNQKVS